MYVLEHANARVKNMKSPKEIKESHYFHETHSRVAHRTPKAKLTERLRKKNSRKRLMLAQRPPFSGVRSLINSPSQGDFSSKRDLSPQENPFPELLFQNLCSKTLL